MENSLVVLKDKEPVTSSLIIAEGMDIEHRAVVRLIEKYIKDFEDLGKGSFGFEIRNSGNTGGRPGKIFFLNEENAIFTISLMRNSKNVVFFKKKLSAAFAKHRRMLAEIYTQRENSEWIERRKMGKVQRIQETDVIKAFIEYAKEQGSKNAEMYYCNLTKMENQSLFFIMEKFPNLREVMDVSQLIAIGAADQIVVKALRDGMTEELSYKEIYQKAKEGVLTFANVIGKSPLPKQITFEDGKTQIEFL